MIRVTESEIEEMRARGYGATTLREAGEAFKRGRAADRIIEQIAEAFAGVSLGDGIGLQQARGLDDYRDDAICAAIREADEKDDWRKFTSDDLNRHNSSLSFFDPEGMRFHLPAYMTAELRGEYGFGMSFCLTNLCDYGRSRFSLLSTSQRQAVREFLLFLREDSDYEFNRLAIDQSLSTFWTDSTTPKKEEAEQ